MIDRLQRQFPNCTTSEALEQARVVVVRQDLQEVFQWLKEESGFDLLVDVTCVDYLNYRGAQQRFGLVYLLANTETSERLTLRVMLDETDLEVPSAVPTWEGADWLEREVWDMFGIHFTGHPDLRRILMPEEFIAHPLRKDYPLQGRGERHNFPVLTRQTGLK
ncbi:MAG: NADH-quinone oxidoreductase subunit C [Planctomycetaceae bacterium]|nr:NADH-quinone oxidoreductase subunit C [Planctomycetaceae bacterium]MBP60364.1 NADH-quinone oxidoreductase subunit C [Planctomycetaceae bacterium]